MKKWILVPVICTAAFLAAMFWISEEDGYVRIGTGDAQAGSVEIE